MHPVLKQMLPTSTPQPQQAHPHHHGPREAPRRAAPIQGDLASGQPSWPRDAQGRFLKRKLSPPPRGYRAKEESVTAPITGGAVGYKIPTPDPAAPVDEGEGLARIRGYDPDTHPRAQLKKDSFVSGLPTDNVLRDDYTEGRGEASAARDLSFRAGRELSRDINSERVLRSEDFERDPNDMRVGPSVGHAHVRAADLVTAYQQTVKQERNFQRTFNSTVRTLLAREETTIGLLHLWDFASALVENPQSKPLTAQLFLVAQHCRDEGVFREALLGLAEPDSRWLFDLLDILQSIVVQDRSMSLDGKVAAINYAVLTLGKHYARRIFRSRFVPLDQEVKVDTFYMRMVLKVLVLAEELGAYRNERLERQIGSGRARRELTDAELLQQLKDSLKQEGHLRAGGGDIGSSLGAGGVGSAVSAARPEDMDDTVPEDEEYGPGLHPHPDDDDVGGEGAYDDDYYY